MEKKKGRKIAKIIKSVIFIAVIVIFVAVTIWLFPLLKDLSTPSGQLAFKEKIDNMGILGVLVLFGLQFAQIFFVVLPGEPLEILAGMCYGPVLGTIFVMGSVFIISSVIVFLVNLLGNRFLYAIWDKSKIKKIKRSKVFKDPRKIEYLLDILFLIPGTPKDLLTYIGGILPIKPLRFILISTFCRFPSIITSTIAGSNIVDGNFKATIIIFVLTGILSIFLIFITSKLDKNAKEAIETIK